MEDSWIKISNAISEDNCFHLFFQRGPHFELDLRDPAVVAPFFLVAESRLD